MTKLNLPPMHPEVIARIHERIRQMTPEELLAFIEYREPGIPETDINGDLLEMYRERREQREAAERSADKSAA